MTIQFSTDDIEVIRNVTESLNNLLKGSACSTVVLTADYPDNEIKSLAESVNETISMVNIFTDSLFSISNGDLTHEIPKGRMKLHDGLKNLQASLNHLTWTTQRIAGGDFNQTVDFMGEFSRAFNSMTLQLKLAFETIEMQNIKLQKKDREMTRDLKLASVIQKTLISDNIRIPGIAVSSVYKPMILVGGDFYSIVEFRNEEKFGVFIADVNGHGVHASLVTGILKVLINTAGEIRSKPSELLYYVNSRIVDLGLDIYFTAFYGICDLKNKKFEYSRGGHNKPFMICGKKNIIELNSDGPMLGVSKEVEIETASIDFRNGDKLLLYTDGLTETENIEGEPFEAKELQRVLNENIGMNIKDYVDTIYKNFTAFRGSEKFDDDVCILGIEFL